MKAGLGMKSHAAAPGLYRGDNHARTVLVSLLSFWAILAGVSPLRARACASFHGRTVVIAWFPKAFTGG